MKLLTTLLRLLQRSLFLPLPRIENLRLKPPQVPIRYTCQDLGNGTYYLTPLPPKHERIPKVYGIVWADVIGDGLLMEVKDLAMLEYIMELLNLMSSELPA